MLLCTVTGTGVSGDAPTTPVRLYVGDVWRFQVTVTDESGARVDLSRFQRLAGLYTPGQTAEVTLSEADGGSVALDPVNGVYGVVVTHTLTARATEASAPRHLLDPEPEDYPTRVRFYLVDAQGEPSTLLVLPIDPKST